MSLALNVLRLRTSKRKHLEVITLWKKGGRKVAEKATEIRKRESPRRECMWGKLSDVSSAVQK